ncbi:hypothetical protein D3C71_1379100 [compost metagenome]
MLGGVDAKTVNAIVTYPLAKPGGQVVACGGAGNLPRGGIGFMAVKQGQATGTGRFSFDVRKESQRHGEIVIAGWIVVTDIGTDPVFAPP